MKIITIGILILIHSASLAQTYATLPYANGFESGALDDSWRTFTNNAAGRIQVTTLNGPLTGSNHLTIDVDGSDVIGVQNEAWLYLDLSGESDVTLEFDWKEFDDEENLALEGVFFSDDNGTTFEQVAFFLGDDYVDETWTHAILDVDALAAANTLTLTSTFIIKFQQYESNSFAIPTDGFAFDNILVTQTATCSPVYEVVSAGTPYIEDFESGVTFGNEWCISANSFSRTQITDQNSPNSGTYHMTMDLGLTGSIGRNEARLHLDLSAVSEVELEFFWKEFGDEYDDPEDGIFFSDDGGSSFTRVATLNGAEFTDDSWSNFLLDVDELANANGLSLTSTFVIEFQQQDNFYINLPGSSDGFAFDDIEVRVAPTCTPAAISSFPYLEDFETGSFGTEWCIPSNSFARTQITTANTPNGGLYHMTMDANPLDNNALNEAELYLDLSAQTDVELEFYWKDFGDENNSTIDGIFFSDDNGANFTQAVILDGERFADNEWKQYIIDIDEVTSAAGLALNSTFVIKFQHFDNWSITSDLNSDGFAFDDIVVRSSTEVSCTPVYASFPYNEGFETGSLGAEWCVDPNNFSRVRVTDQNLPFDGTYHLTQDVDPSGNPGLNEALLHVDLSGLSNVQLDFYWKEFGDENSPQDGISFSDDNGVNFTQVFPLIPESSTDNTWQLISLDVDDLVAGEPTLDLSSTFVIKFQQFDNVAINIANLAGSDGFAFDNISLYVAPTIWTGTTDTDWHTASNWTNGIPVADADVTIPDVSGVSGNFPILSADGSTGNLTVESGSQITISASINLTVSGDFDNQGNANIGTGTVTFDASSDQTINGSTEFENVTINNSSGTVTILSNQLINGLLTLTNGILETDINTLSMAATATTSSGSDASHINGVVSKLGASDFEFPIGNNGRWAPLTISNLTGDASTVFTAQYLNSAYSDLTNFRASDPNGDLNNVSSIEYWTLDNTGTASIADLTLHWKNQSNSSINNYSDLVIAHYNTGMSEWENLGQTNVISSDPGSITVNGVSSFSPFTFGSTSALVNPLPIDLLYFEAKEDNNSVLLNWATASETNNEKFIISKSSDGKEFSVIKTVDGAGNSRQEKKYQVIDPQPYSGISYYKLTQVDYDGKSESIITNFVYSNSQTVKIFPNPLQSTDRIEIAYQSGAESVINIVLIDPLGNEIVSEKRTIQPNLNNELSFKVPTLTKGVYILTIQTVNVFLNERIIVE
ncbi:MAG: T9SS type A sorting domain-containing protein [Bacteroidota bacterium]